MIPCMKCGEPATTHLSHVSSGGLQKTLHLCAACAEQEKLVEGPSQQLSIPTILQALIGANLGSWSEELARLACPSCGIKYMEFRAVGRLGCPHDYAVFRSGLESLLKKIHRATRHAGKQPRRSQLTMEMQWELLRLRRELREAIEQEAYERAAELRDQLRQKECQA